MQCVQLATDCYSGVCNLRRIATVRCRTWDGLLLWGVQLATDCHCSACNLGRIATVRCATWDGLLLWGV